MIELIGFEKEYSNLLKRYKLNNLPNSILIHGLSGIGKRTFLKKLVKNILNIEGKPKIEVPLIAEKDVSEINPLFKIFAAAKYLIFGRSLDEIK